MLFWPASLWHSVTGVTVGVLSRARRWPAVPNGCVREPAALTADITGRPSGDCWRHENRCCRSCCQGCSCYGRRTARCDRTPMPHYTASPTFPIVCRSRPTTRSHTDTASGSAGQAPDTGARCSAADPGPRRPGATSRGARPAGHLRAATADPGSPAQLPGCDAPDHALAARKLLADLEQIDQQVESLGEKRRFLGQKITCRNKSRRNW